MTGRLTPTLGFVLGSVVLLTTTVLGDSSTDSLGVTPATSGARSSEIGRDTVGAIELRTSSGRGSHASGDFDDSSESIRTPVLTDDLPSTSTPAALGQTPFTDMPIVDDRNVRDGQPVTHPEGKTHPIAAVLRTLVIGSFGFLVIRRLQRPWKK